MTSVIRSVVRCAETETVGAAGAAKLHVAEATQAKFVMCDESIEQGHRGVKRVTRPMLGFKSFGAAQCTLAGIELVHMLRKGQLEGGVEHGQTLAEPFYSLAA
jgi:putative transposase